jgi:hypothetical protein
MIEISFNVQLVGAILHGEHQRMSLSGCFFWSDRIGSFKTLIRLRSGCLGHGFRLTSYWHHANRQMASWAYRTSQGFACPPDHAARNSRVQRRKILVAPSMITAY